MKRLSLIFLFFSQVCLAAPKISLNLSYKSIGDDLATKKTTLKEGERFETHYKRGDIDTYISMSPRHEMRKGKKIILIDFEVQNMRDGDLISESNAQVTTSSGKKANLSFNDEQLDDTLTVSVTPKTL